MTDEELIAAVRSWLTEHWDAVKHCGRGATSPLEWRQRVHAAGYAVPSWPGEFGGLGVSAEQSKLVEREFRQVHAPGAGQDRTNLPANTLLQFGTDKAKADLLARLVTGEYSWCLLYSEPGAGSDLAAVRTRAERQGDHYLINGQKVWTSGAHSAAYGLLLARTDWDVPKHAGVSYMICPMKQPGIEVRPIHQITGERHFNEVFIDNARVPAEYLLSTEGNGWKVMQTALAYERLMMGEGASERRFDRRDEDNRADLIGLARRHGSLSDPVLRQEIAQAIAWRRINELNAQRAKQAAAAGRASPLMSIRKLAMSRILHNDARVMRRILGAESLLDGPDFPDAGDVNYRSLHAYMNSIGGGTDQIQRNIIGERVLGLPREIEVDRNIPFRESLTAKADKR
jgi:alkylation response protein AidB-like acyl-CoA dehydrogenase